MTSQDYVIILLPVLNCHKGYYFNSMIELVNKAYYSTVTELKFSVTVQDVAVLFANVSKNN